MVNMVIYPEFSYAIFVAVSSVFVLFWMGLKTGMTRRKLGVEYPLAYSNENEGKNAFNCHQRAHQNTLENYPQFLMLLFAGSLYHPVLCSAAGLEWLVSRILYARGYYTGDPNNRRIGAILGYLGLFTMIYCCISGGLSLFRAV